MADAALELSLAGQDWLLLADRAAYWPRQQLLVIADLHLGKGVTFRRSGIAVPHGGTANDLARLTQLVAQTGARRLLVLGDFIHGSLAAAEWLTEWQRWRRQHANLTVDCILGNHDRALRSLVSETHAGAQSAAAAVSTDATTGPKSAQEALAEINWHGRYWVLGPYLFVHDVSDATGSAAGCTSADDAYVLAGHWHPVLRLPGLPQLPCFCVDQQHMVLPAFTGFAGGRPVSPVDCHRVAVCAPGTVIWASRER